MPDRLDNSRGDDVETVLGRLTQTIEWCVPRVRVADPKSCLRTPKLHLNPLAGCRKDVVKWVADERHCELGCNPPLPAADLRGGRLLLYEPDLNLFDGLAETETFGYVDFNSIPPWDTWVAYIVEPGRRSAHSLWRRKLGMEYLLSWVPPEFISLVGEGIDVDPNESFRWLDREERVLTRILRDRRLLFINEGL